MPLLDRPRGCRAARSAHRLGREAIVLLALHAHHSIHLARLQHLNGNLRPGGEAAGRCAARHGTVGGQRGR